jgi:PBP1b-binding outer membrane lipoprotein LpoB
MKRIITLLAVALVLGGLSACKPSSNGPEAAAKNAIEALQKGDYDTYAASFNLSDEDQKMLAGMVEEKVKEDIDKKGGIKDYKITDTQIDGDKAKVQVLLRYENGSEDDTSMSFVKVDDEWKQEFNK